MKKEKYQKYFQGKKITLMGLGLLGRNLGDAQFLAENGADLIVTDLKTEQELKNSLQQLKQFPKIKFSLGGHKKEDFQERDFILKGNGVSLNNEFIMEAEKNNIPIKMSLSWVFDILRTEKVQPILVGITGTKGKSTVTAMLESIFKIYVKKNKEKRFLMAGNIKGLAGLALLEKITEKDFVIAELDSWQLQGFGTEKISPAIVIWTNFFADHLNYYSKMSEYFSDKNNIIQFQNKNDFLVTLPENIPIFSAYTNLEKISAKLELAFRDEFPQDWSVQFFGKYMFKNAVLAKKAAELLNIPDQIIQEGLENFSGVSGRMEFLGEKKGIIFYNDNSSTTPTSTLVGLKALQKKYPEKRILLIGGGTDKGFEFKELTEFIEKNIFYSYFLTASGTDKIIKNFSKNFSDFAVVDLMEDIEKKIKEKTKEGDLIVLSPACSSFGKQFKNEYERSEQFIKLFEKI